jgi:tripartite-type tricarboxylate transporter receptor subunit TctC
MRVLNRRARLKDFAAIALAMIAKASFAQAERALKIIVPFAPGGGNDVFARALIKGLSELRGQAVVVENKAGAGGNLGTAEVIRSAADGNTLLLGHSGTVSINPVLHKGLKFDARVDLHPVAMFAQSAFVLVVPGTTNIQSISGLISDAKSTPGAWNFASAGSGISMRHIPYKGTALALADVAGSQVQMCFSVIPPALALIKAGKLRAVAVTSSSRLASLPNVPTLSESGLGSLKGFESTVTYGLLAPAATPKAIVRELETQVLKVASSPEFQQRLISEGAVAKLGGSDEYARLIKLESTKWGQVVTISGATAE